MYSVCENSDNGNGFTVTQLWNVDTSFPVDDVGVLRIAAGTFCCVDGDSVVVVVVGNIRFRISSQTFLVSRSEHEAEVLVLWLGTGNWRTRGMSITRNRFESNAIY